MLARIRHKTPTLEDWRSVNTPTADTAAIRWGRRLTTARTCGILRRILGFKFKCRHAVRLAIVQIAVVGKVILLFKHQPQLSYLLALTIPVPFLMDMFLGMRATLRLLQIHLGEIRIFCTAPMIMEVVPRFQMQDRAQLGFRPQDSTVEPRNHLHRAEPLTLSHLVQIPRAVVFK